MRALVNLVPISAPPKPKPDCRDRAPKASHGRVERPDVFRGVDGVVPPADLDQDGLVEGPYTDGRKGAAIPLEHREHLEHQRFIRAERYEEQKPGPR
jgi:hypothetical protein